MYVHVRIGLLPGGGGWVRARTTGNRARRGELDHARVVPCGIGWGMQRIRTPVNEGERAAHVGDEEVLRRRGVRADRAKRVRERDYVRGWLRARAGPPDAADADAWAGGGR